MWGTDLICRSHDMTLCESLGIFAIEISFVLWLFFLAIVEMTTALSPLLTKFILNT
jgi:hypothetical protein